MRDPPPFLRRPDANLVRPLPGAEAQASDMHAFTQPSLLVWGGAPGTVSDGTDLDRDAPAYSLSTDSGDDPDPDEHSDFC